MNIDATQEGVSEEEHEEQEATRTKRDEDFETLVAARNKEREQEEPMQFGDVEPEQEPEPQEQEPEKEPEPDNRIVLYGEDGEEIKLSPKAKIKLKIDGQEQEESLEQMTRSYQKGVAADKRLETAAQRQKELQQLEQQLIAKGSELSRREQFILEEVQKLQASEKKGKTAGLSKDAQEENLKKAKALFDAIVDSEDPINKIASVLPLLTPELPPQIDLETIRNEVKTEIRTEQASSELNKARKAFGSEYPELAKDPELFHLVNERTKWLQDVRPNADFWEIIKEAAEGVKARFVAPVPQPEPKEQPPVATRIPTPRKAGGRSTIGKDPVPQTREQILDEIRKTRVQTAL